MIIDGKEIKLTLNLEIYEELCKRGFWVEEIDETLKGKNQVEATCEMISIMGAFPDGTKPDAGWVKKNLPFNGYVKAKNEIIMTIVSAMKSETAEEESADAVVDEVLEEIEKKSTPTN